MAQDNALDIATDIVDRYEAEKFGEISDSNDWLVSQIRMGLETYLAKELQETTYVSYTLHNKLLKIYRDKVDLLRDALKLTVDQYGKKGGPWNVPNQAGSWIAAAKAVLEETK